MNTLTSEDTVYVSKINFDDHIENLRALFDQDGFTISWSSSGPLENGESGGFNRYRIQNATGRPLFFLEDCILDQDHILRIFLITDSKNKSWNEELQKNPDLFGPSRYYSNSVSSCLDDVHFQALASRYLAFEIAPHRINQSQKEILKELLTVTFVGKVKNTGDKYDFGNLKDWFQKHFS